MLKTKVITTLAFVGISFAQLSSATTRQPLLLNSTQYRLRAGEATRIVAPQDTCQFIAHARDRRISIGGVTVNGLVLSVNETGDEIVLGASLTTTPGEYSAQLSATDASGQERVVTLDVVLDPIETVPSNATKPPVVLLNGWQAPFYGSLSTCPISTTSPHSAGTFGGLQQQLLATGVPAVYFFDNCVEGPNAKIEDLGNTLGQVLALIKFDNGTTVPQIDLIGHSMGGLIARAYLAGLQSNGSLSLPSNPRTRKLIEIATPNFGSFLAPTILLGDQTHELVPGSSFLWNLGTWNQSGDDLRGVDALAIIGNAGSWDGVANASDGVVSLTSASLGFARDASRTRILPYCHVDTSFGTSLVGVTCSGKGIANVDNAPETAQLVLAFLANTLDTVSVGHVTPAQDPLLSKYGGLYVAYETTAAQWVTDLTAASLGNVTLQQGYESGEDFYVEFVSGTGTVQATSSSLGTLSCGPVTAPVGYYNVLRCKSAPTITSVGPLISNSLAKIVVSGGTITVSGSGFGQQRCSTCSVTAYPGATLLQVSSWSDQTITAVLPATYSGLLVQLLVVTASGTDSMNIVAGVAPVLSLSKTHAGSFVFGQSGAIYTMTVSNTSSSGQTSGTVTVTENVPTGETLVSMTGSGWSCSGSSCTRGDVLSSGSSYPAITVTVNVASNAPSQVTNQATVSGGGSVSATANDVTNIGTVTGKVATTMTMAASASSIATTGSTTLTATVTAAGGSDTPTGAVAFDLGSTVLGSATLTGTGGIAQATLAVNGSQLAVGSNSITANYSGDANHNASAASVTVTVTSSTTAPDLVVSSLTGPTNGNPGGTVVVSATVLNQGGSGAGASKLEFYFSPTSGISLSTAVDTGWSCAITGLASGTSQTCSGPVGVPANLTPGTWYLAALADSGNQVVESNENNNWRIADTGPVTLGPVLKILGAGSDGRLYSIVPTTGATTLIGPLATVMSDIAAYDGSLYGISYSTPSVLYGIDPNTGAGTAIGSGTGATLDALVFSPSGTLYAAGADSLYTINTSTGNSTLVGSGSGAGTYSSSGDLEFDATGKLYLTSVGFSGDQLFSLNPATGQGTSIGNIGFSGVLGLAYYSGIVYGFTSGGQVITINLSTGVGTAIASYTPGLNGTTLFAPGATAPSISSGGVANAASYATGAVAPGSIAAVFGSFPVTSPSTAPGAPWPTSLGGLSVQFDTTQAPLYYASGSQVNLQVPWEVSGQTQTTINATSNGQVGAAQTVSLATYAPGIFSMNGQGTGQGAIVDAISGRLLDPSNPAIAGSTYVSIYCTGLGPVTNQPASGAASPSNPLAKTTTTPIVGIGNTGSQVLFAGLAPGFVGEYQVNALVPAGVTPGNAVPVVVSIGGVYSNTVTIAVQAAAASNPQPSIANLSPSSAQAGSSPLTLAINGNGFIASSSVTINGASRVATFVNTNQLTITLTASDLATAGTLSVVVTNPPPGGGSSQSSAFTVQPAATPTLVGLSLNVATLTAGASTTGTVRLSAAAPSGGVQVSLSSSNPSAQVPAAVTVAAGQSTATFTITTTAVASTQTATITATLGTGHFSLNLSVNPASGGVSLQGKSFTINGTITIGGQALAFEIQTLATSATAYFVELDNDISAASGIQFEEEFNSGLSVSGSTGVYSGSSAAGFYSNLNTNYGMPITITSATLTITFTSSAPGSAVTGSVSFATASGTIQGTFTGTLASPGLT